MHIYVHSSTIHNNQTMETTKIPIDRWMDKEDMIHIYNEILSSVQLVSRVRLFVTPWTAAHQASLSITNS